ncbi:MAG: hypothetical protein A3K19_14620 [Lentisphaerae bacterium RIFOXYB12_FULL_65_16]|nr:MAG: hypothetical protein A3K18_28685 [Lentisphaerae bacterium RIFOXYA12_64_32]OGV87456.1 MAG: hypothetical protein A3K19_14620 [Lentisphaerae bacterium RIFOXYB12_FULL_65_16]
MPHQLRKPQWRCQGHSIRVDRAASGATLAGLTLAGELATTGALGIRYRFLLGEPTAWKPLTWDRTQAAATSLTCKGSLVLNASHSFGVNLRIRAVSYAAPGGRRFSGLAFRFAATQGVAWPVELEVSLPLGKGPWRGYLQDLDSPIKAAAANPDWRGFAWRNWQGQRSPFDLFASKTGALWCRLSTLSEMFSSGAKWAPDSGLVATYRFTFGSETRWQSADLAFLVLPERRDERATRDLWAGLFLAESERFRTEAGVRREEVVPMANIPIDGGTPGCAPKGKLKIQGTFDEIAERVLRTCAAMNYRRVMIGSPWVSQRTEGIWFKALPSITYDSRCGIIDIEISPKYGGRPAFRRFCRQAHAEGVEVFAWYPGFHLSNFSPYLTQHPDWLMRKPDGSPFTYVYFHIAALSPRLEVQQFFLDRLQELKRACEFDGLWLDSYNLSFMALDFYRKQGVSGCQEAIDMVKRLQDIGIRVINEGFSPFGARGDGETLAFLGQEDMAVETTLFTYQGHIDKVLEGDAYFRFLANKAPLTMAATYIPARARQRIAAWNAAYHAVVGSMLERHTLPDDRGVLWSDGARILTLFCYRDAPFVLPGGGEAVDLLCGTPCSVRSRFGALQGHVYQIRCGAGHATRVLSASYSG